MRVSRTVLGEHCGEVPLCYSTLLLEEDIPYQVIVALMDTTRSYQDVLITSVVDAELFPEISLGDAPASVATAELVPGASSESSGSAK